ncbi:12968_t:CDS:2 [Gigaspora rosea]|nr:12968_t:CDS:2 [Gigaspora rosea]
MRSDIEIKKLFQKEEQEIVGILGEYKNRTLKKDNTIADYLGIQHVELVCVIRETIQVYDYIQHKIVRGQQVSTKEMELLEIIENQDQPNKENSSSYEFKQKCPVTVQTQIRSKRFTGRNRTNEVKELQVKFQSMSTQKENKESYSTKMDSSTHVKVQKDITASRWALQNRARATSTKQTQIAQVINDTTNTNHNKQKPTTIITLWDLPEDA